MADRIEQVVYRATLGSVGTRYVIAEVVQISTNDTVTVDSMTIITATAVFRLDTGAVQTATVTGTSNVITFTQGTTTNVPVVVIATGY